MPSIFYCSISARGNAPLSQLWIPTARRPPRTLPAPERSSTLFASIPRRFQQEDRP